MDAELHQVPSLCQNQAAPFPLYTANISHFHHKKHLESLQYKHSFKKALYQNISSKNLVLSSPLHLTYHSRLFTHFGAAWDFLCWTDGLRILASWYCTNIFLSCTTPQKLLYFQVTSQFRLQKKKSNKIGNLNNCFPTFTADLGPLWHWWVKSFFADLCTTWSVGVHTKPFAASKETKHSSNSSNSIWTSPKIKRESGHSAILYLQRQNDLFK